MKVSVSILTEKLERRNEGKEFECGENEKYPVRWYVKLNDGGQVITET